MRTCERFAADGTPCTNRADNRARWCGRCDGFRRAKQAPPDGVNRPPRGTTRHIEESDQPDIPVVDPYAVRVTKTAEDSYRYLHGGNAPSARYELQQLLEAMLDESVRIGVDRGPFYRLARDGYELVLSPTGDAITGYDSSHRDRTWAQFEAGIKSRSPRTKRTSARHPSAGCAVSIVLPGEIAISKRARSSAPKVTGGEVEPERREAVIRNLLPLNMPFEGRIQHDGSYAFIVNTTPRVFVVVEPELDEVRRLFVFDGDNTPLPPTPTSLPTERVDTPRADVVE